MRAWADVTKVNERSDMLLQLVEACHIQSLIMTGRQGYLSLPCFGISSQGA